MDIGIAATFRFFSARPVLQRSVSMDTSRLGSMKDPAGETTEVTQLPGRL